MLRKWVLLPVRCPQVKTEELHYCMHEFHHIRITYKALDSMIAKFALMVSAAHTHALLDCPTLSRLVIEMPGWAAESRRAISAAEPTCLNLWSDWWAKMWTTTSWPLVVHASVQRIWSLSTMVIASELLALENLVGDMSNAPFQLSAYEVIVIVCWIGGHTNEVSRIDEWNFIARYQVSL